MESKKYIWCNYNVYVYEADEENFMNFLMDNNIVFDRIEYADRSDTIRYACHCTADDITAINNYIHQNNVMALTSYAEVPT